MITAIKEYWLLNEELKFGPEVSSNPKDHACLTVVYRIPICTDQPDKATRLIEYEAYENAGKIIELLGGMAGNPDPLEACRLISKRAAKWIECEKRKR